MNVRPYAPYIALAVAGTALAVLFAPQFENANVLRPFDYMQYWSAGRAVLNGQNPYDGNVLYPYQQQIGTSWEQPVMMWNPPWTLPIAVGLGSVHWRVGQLMWFALNLACVLASAVMLWRMYAGNRSVVIPALIALGFGPTVFLLLLGQISGLVLLGVVGFLTCIRTDRYALAGCFLALTAIKPHLLAPFALVLALESIRTPPLRRTILTGLGVLAIGGAIPLLWNADIWGQYRAGTSASSSDANNTISEWIHPTIGFLLREALPGHPRWAMFIPLALAIPFTIAYWMKHRDDWSWTRGLPLLVLVSLIAAPYGAWGFDLVLLLVPVIQAAVWLAVSPHRKLWIFAYAAFNAVLLLTLLQKDSMTNYWITPVVLVGFLVVNATRQSNTVSARLEAATS